MVIVDTHIIIWESLKPDKLSQKAKTAFDTANESDGIIFCDISLWEISMLISKKRLEIDIGFLEYINLLFATKNYKLQSITPEIADVSTSISSEINGDPADRLIAATSICNRSQLITADKNLLHSKKLNTIW